MKKLSFPSVKVIINKYSIIINYNKTLSGTTTGASPRKNKKLVFSEYGPIVQVGGKSLLFAKPITDSLLAIFPKEENRRL